MNRADLKRLEEVFAAAVERTPGEQDAFVAAACRDDPALAARVRRMLADAAAAAGFLETPAMAFGPASADEGASRDALLGQRIGRYEILRIIGVGGMGVVYEARQDRPDRKVALKLLRPGWMSPMLLRRFEREAEMLGRLHHPAVAQIYEAGTVEVLGVRQPFLAMELVRGKAITRYATEMDLSRRERLEMIARVCDGVQHAHHKGVIHRDLKPANVLVDDSGQPKILDFGVARATDADIVATTMQTSAGQLVGTIAYMSPEQARGRSDELDTRSDVYSLGVMLFELLTGRLPHDVADKPIGEAVRLIGEDPPTHLSTIDRSFRGDIDTIAAKALEKDRARRYQSAAELADDIRRFLRDEPIMARPASRAYQFAKFAKRHRGPVAGAAATLLVLVAALVIVSVLAVRIQRERVRAEEINWFMDQLLSAADPFQSTTESGVARHFGVGVRLVDVLDEIVLRLDERPLRDPVAEAMIRQKLATSFFGLGRFDDGVAAADRALAVLRARFGDYDRRVLACKLTAANNRVFALDSYEAERLAQETVEGCIRVYGEHHEETLRAMHCLWLASVYVDDIEQANQVLHRMLDILRTSPRPLDFAGFVLKAGLANQAVWMNNPVDGYAWADEAMAEAQVSGHQRTPWRAFAHIALGRAWGHRGDFVAAEQHVRDGLEIWGASATLPPEFKQTLADMIVRQPGREEEGLALLRAAVDEERELQGAHHPMVLLVLPRLAAALNDAGRHEEAEAVYQEYLTGLSTRPHVLLQRHAWVRYRYGRFLEEQDRLEEAEQQYRDAFEVAEQFTRQQWTRAWSDDRFIAFDLARLLWRQGRFEEAEPLFALLRDRLNEPGDPWKHKNLAWRYYHLGKFQEAELLARRGLDGLEPFTSQVPYRTLDAAAVLVAALYAQERDEEARAAWRAGEAIMRSHPPRPGITRVARHLAERFVALHRFEEAESVFALLTESLGQRLDPEDPELRNGMAAMYQAWGREEEAERFRQPRTALAPADEDLTGAGNP